MGELARLRALTDEHLAHDLRSWHRGGLWLLLLTNDPRLRAHTRTELARRRARHVDGPTADLTGRPVEWDGSGWVDREA